MDPGTAMLAGAGLDFVGGLLGSAGRGKAARQQLQHQLFLDREARAFNDKWAERSEAFARDSRDRRVQIAAADARAAGLHPLFALGAATGGSPGFMAGQSSSGSAASAAVSDSGPGGAIRAAGSALQRWAGQQQTKQQIEANELDLRLKRANAERAEFELEQLRLSALAKSTQTAGYNPRTGISVVAPDGDPPQISDRPTVAYPRESHTDVARIPGHTLPYMPVSLGGDEVNQLAWVANVTGAHLAEEAHAARERARKRGTPSRGLVKSRDRAWAEIDRRLAVAKGRRGRRQLTRGLRRRPYRDWHP